ncbi:WhiB family transcriptional regulator [Mycolicibacterium lacusdiani]|uniref:WhiB family transcriptional regulator n=1 Tax=Mycolicibacterium lacusdiani TaxID=2895283 RepID=UPI001F25085B|nr:WhiB family transcriptional regulator [Mycolicibacterium lacusdiani]
MTGADVRLDGDATVALLATVLRDQPKLPRALCAGDQDTFDCTDGAQVQRAVALCGVCPELERCTTWAAGQRQLVGVVAGKYYRHKEWK